MNLLRELPNDFVIQRDSDNIFVVFESEFLQTPWTMNLNRHTHIL